MPSIRSSSRARTESQRGFVLVIALVLAILYFMLMGLVMIDSSRAQTEAQRYRARVLAATLAENAAELACAQMVTLPGGVATLQDAQGTMTGTGGSAYKTASFPRLCPRISATGPPGGQRQKASHHPAPRSYR